MKPITELDPRYSTGHAAPTEWAEACDGLTRAETFWLSTVRPDGGPHVTPLLAIWHDDALYFCTGAAEQKVRNLKSNRHCTLTTGVNALNEGLDLVVEGVAEQVTDNGRLTSLADAYEAKYGSDWRFEVRDGAFHSKEAGHVLVFEVAPVRAYGFRKGEYSQTRWRF